MTRVPSRTAAPAVAPLVRSEVRDLVARCLDDGPDGPLGAGAADDERLSAARRLRADRLLLALAAAGLAITADGALSPAA